MWQHEFFFKPCAQTFTCVCGGGGGEAQRIRENKLLHLTMTNCLATSPSAYWSSGAFFPLRGRCFGPRMVLTILFPILTTITRTSFPRQDKLSTLGKEALPGTSEVKVKEPNNPNPLPSGRKGAETEQLEHPRAPPS